MNTPKIEFISLGNVCETVKLLAGFLQCNDGKLEEADYSIVLSSFIVCSNQNRPTLVRDLLSYNLMSVGQISCTIRTTGLQLNKSLPEVIYFLIRAHLMLNQRTNGPVNAHLISVSSISTKHTNPK